MVPMGNYSKKHMPSTLSRGCFSYISRLKWCLQELLPQTHAQYALYWMFPLNIHDEMVPTRNSSHKPMPSTLFAECILTNPGWNAAYRNSSHKLKPSMLYGMFLLKIQTELLPIGNLFHKPMPGMLPRERFLYTSTLKWCLQELLLQTNA